jgi:hypothetical protein
MNLFEKIAFQPHELGTIVPAVGIGFYQGVKKKKDDYEAPKTLGAAALGGLAGFTGVDAYANMKNKTRFEFPTKSAVTIGGVGALSGLIGYGFGRAVRSAMGGKEDPNNPSDKTKQQTLLSKASILGTAGGLGAAGYYKAKQVIKDHRYLLMKDLNKDIKTRLLDDIDPKQKKSLEEKLRDNNIELNKMEKTISKLGRNAKLGLAAAGLGAAGLAYDHFKNN